MDLSQITRIVELMSKHDLTEIDIKSEELALTIKRERKEPPRETQIITTVPAVAPMMPAPLPAAAAAAPAEAPKAAASETAGLVAIESPLVGTFYASPAPDAAPFVKVGDRVTKDTVVCIIEAMKVMNEIKAECSGTIRKVNAGNAQPVEFGQPLFWLQAD